MKLKKRSLLTVLAVAQLAAAYPASADANTADKPQQSVTQEVYEQNAAATKAVTSGGTDAAQETTETTETNTTTETEGSQEPNETGTTEGPVEETGEVQDPATTTGEQDNQNNQQTVTGKELILYFNSTKMVQDGITYNAPHRCKSKREYPMFPFVPLWTV